ncbi:Histidine kinase-, DNA gyrase B-, and HSP90-like ATPase [compost metagenome]
MRREDHVVLSVYDNGRGMPEETVQKLVNGTYVGTGNGFGSINIKERLALYFGEEACYTIESAAGEWTLVTIEFPVCSQQPSIRKGGKHA